MDGLALFNYCFLGVGRGTDESLAVRLISRSFPLSFTPQSVTPSSASIQSIYVIGGEMDIAHG